MSKIIAMLRRKKAGTGQIMENFFLPKKLKDMLKKNGFEVEEFKTVYFKPDYIYEIIKRLSNSFGLYQVYLTKKMKEVKR